MAAVFRFRQETSMISPRALVRLAIAAGASLSLALPLFAADDSERLLTVDHYVKVKSTVPAIAGQTSEIYVREKVLAGPALRSATPKDRVVVFVHGAGTPAEVAFDVPYQDYSWMAYLARRLRRVLNGHDRLRAFDAALADERSVQSRKRSPGSIRSGAVRAELCACADDHPIRLG
jgi:hypothetical protein